MKSLIKREVMAAGAVAAGVAAAADISPEAAARFAEWLGEGAHAGMDYLERHASLRLNPSSVLEGAVSVISVAFSFAPEEWRSGSLPGIAAYAYGDDYHEAVRSRLNGAVSRLRDALGGEWRVCIDSAPIAERYWAMRAGIGRMGRNGCVIVDGHGSMVFLAEIVTTLAVEPDEPSDLRCMDCGACLRSCPQGALRGDGTVDSRRCLSYLTIEHRGEWEGEMLEAMQTPAGRNALFGCDVCLRICPHNRGVKPSEVAEFRLREEYSALTAERARALTQPEFSALFRRSAIKRCKLAGLLRNARNLRDEAQGSRSEA